MTSNCKFMLVYEFSGPKVSISNFSSISFQMADFHFFLEPNPAGTFHNFVAMITAQNVANWFDLQNVS